MLAKGLKRRIWTGAAAWLLSLALCLGAVGDLRTGSPSLQAPLGLAGEICHSPGADKQDDGGAEPRTAHNCCVACHAAQGHPLAPPSLALVGPVGPATDVVFAPSADTTPPNAASRHNNARAPPSA